MASFDEQIRQARREYSLADRAFQELEEGAGKDAVQINQLQEDVTRQVTAVRQTMNRIDGTIREAPASLRNPQEEMQAQQLNEKVVMLERGLDRFVGRNSSREREKQERCALAALSCRLAPCTPTRAQTAHGAVSV
jgi:chromosome segregation ATPase